MFWKKHYHTFVLLIIIGLSATLRLTKLQSLPRDAHVDEVMNAYVGQFTLRNGFDLYGNPYPVLYFDNFGDFPNILPMYLSGLSTWLFGNTEWAIRLPIAIFGVIGVVLVYYLARLLYTAPAAALLAAFTLAIFPWHITLSRATAEGVTAGSVYILGIFLLLRSLQLAATKTKQSVWPLFLGFGLGFAMLLLSYLLYPSYRIIVPLSLWPLFLLAQTPVLKKLTIIMTIVSFGLTFVISQTAWGTGRFDQTSIFGQQSPVWALQGEFISGEGFDQALKARFFYNKIFMFGREFVQQYLSYFSPNFLFAPNGLPMRYFVPATGLWYYSYLAMTVIVVIFGLTQPTKFRKIATTIFKNQQGQRFYYYLIYLLAIAPVAAALTIDDSPNVHRAALMPLILSLLSGTFIILYQAITSKKWRVVATLVVVVMLSFEVMDYFNKYSQHSAKFQQVYRSPAIKNLVAYLHQQRATASTIFVEKKGETAVFYLFYNQIFDAKLSTQFAKKLQLAQLDNIYFTEHTCVHPKLVETQLQPGKNIFIVSSACAQDYPQIWHSYPNFEEIDQIHSRQGDVIFRVYQLELTAQNTGLTPAANIF